MIMYTLEHLNTPSLGESGEGKKENCEFVFKNERNKLKVDSRAGIRGFTFSVCILLDLYEITLLKIILNFLQFLQNFLYHYNVLKNNLN